MVLYRPQEQEISVWQGHRIDNTHQSHSYSYPQFFNAAVAAEAARNRNRNRNINRNNDASWMNFVSNYFFQHQHHQHQGSTSQSSNNSASHNINNGSNQHSNTSPPHGPRMCPMCGQSINLFGSPFHHNATPPAPAPSAQVM